MRPLCISFEALTVEIKHLHSPELADEPLDIVDSEYLVPTIAASALCNEEMSNTELSLVRFST